MSQRAPLERVEAEKDDINRRGRTMTKWEYKSLQASEEYSDIHGTYWEYITEEQLNALGAKGWEVVTIRYGRHSYIESALLKRPVSEGAE